MELHTDGRADLECLRIHVHCLGPLLVVHERDGKQLCVRRGLEQVAVVTDEGARLVSHGL